MLLSWRFTEVEKWGEFVSFVPSKDNSRKYS